MGIRRIGHNLCPPGWVYERPTMPERCCSWCGRPNVTVRRCVICVACDTVQAWPNSQEARAA